MNKVNCGYDKYSIGVDVSNCAVVVKFNRHPINGELLLYDVAPSELRKLSEVFLDAAREMESE